MFIGKNVMLTGAIFFMSVLFADAYPLSHCAVTGKDISHLKKPASYNYKGNNIKFLNGKALKKFKKNPSKYMRVVRKKIVKEQQAYYPTNKCLVSGEILDNHSIDIVYKNRLVRLCCKSCVKDFKENFSKYIEKLDKMVIHRQEQGYPLANCVVMEDEPLGGQMGKPIDFVHANQLIRFCCDGCIKKFRRNPSMFMKKIRNKYLDHRGHNHNHHNH